MYATVHYKCGCKKDEKIIQGTSGALLDRGYPFKVLQRDDGDYVCTEICNSCYYDANINHLDKEKS